MTDLSKEIMEKANGGLKLNPDEQRRFLGTFEERVLGYADLRTSNMSSASKGLLKVLKAWMNKHNPLFVKVSPNVDSSVQLSYLKQAKEFGCQATIVSEEHDSSPFGLVIHTDAPVTTTDKDLRTAFSDLWEEEKKLTKPSLWKKWFG